MRELTPCLRNPRRMAQIALVLMGAQPASAVASPSLPSLFDITGIAGDDVLNIRATASARADIIGTLSADARAIEVVAMDDSRRWAQVNAGERSGWVASRYLAHRIEVWAPGGLPTTLQCFGTEPFWSLAPEQDALAFSTMGGGDQRLSLDVVLDSGVPGWPRRAIIARSDTRTLTATITQADCSDGMSDRSYGLETTVILQEAGEFSMLTGCCSIAPR